MIIGIAICVVVVVLIVKVDHILKLSLLVIELSQILVDGLMVDQSVHQIIRILG
jgi:hypothetical protein